MKAYQDINNFPSSNDNKTKIRTILKKKSEVATVQSIKCEGEYNSSHS